MFYVFQLDGSEVRNAESEPDFYEQTNIPA